MQVLVVQMGLTNSRHSNVIHDLICHGSDIDRNGRQEARPAGRNEGRREGKPLRHPPGGVYVFAPDATVLGILDTDVPTANCAFGDDGSTLYIAANDSLSRIRTTTKGR